MRSLPERKVLEESDELLAANEGEHRQGAIASVSLAAIRAVARGGKKTTYVSECSRREAAIEAQFGVDLETIILRAAVRDFPCRPPHCNQERVQGQPGNSKPDQGCDDAARVRKPVLSYYTAMSIHVVGEDDTAKLKIQNDKESEPKTSNLSPLTSNPPPIDWRTLMSPVAVPSGPVSFPTTEEYSALADTLIQEATLPGISSLLEQRGCGRF